MAIERFIEGKWYRWVGPKDFHSNWSAPMEAWKDGKPRKCTVANPCSFMRAAFEGIYGCWHYNHCTEHFVLVSAPARFTSFFRGALQSIKDVNTRIAGKRRDRKARKRELKRKLPAVMAAPVKISLPEEELTMVVDIARIRSQALKALDAPTDENLLQQLL